MQYESQREPGAPLTEPGPDPEQRAIGHPKPSSISDLKILQGHLHPMTLAFTIYRSVRRWIVPALPLFLFNNRMAFALIMSLVIASAIARALVRYFTFSYRIEGGELITREGLFERNERHIPLERVQEIRIEQGVLHRLFGVVDASVETAGGQGPEASLSVLSRREAERLREAVSRKSTAQAAGRSEAVSPAPERAVIRKLQLSDLILAGMTSNHLLSALVLIGTLWAFVDDIVPEEFYRRAAGSIYDQATRLLAQGIQAAIAVAIAGVLLIFMVSLLFSILGSVALFYGFTLSQTGEDLHRAYGLLTRRSSSLPRRRIQVIEIKEGLLRRLFHLASLRADTAGGNSGERESSNAGRDVLLPIARRNEVARLLRTIFPDLEPDERRWAAASRLAILRGAANGALAVLLAAGALCWYQQNLYGLWLLILLPAVWVANVLGYRNLGYKLDGRYFYTRRGWPGRTTHIVPVRNVQAVVVHQSPVDRRLGVATLIVDSAGQKAMAGGPRVANLPLEEARAVAALLARNAAATRFRWR